MDFDKIAPANFKYKLIYHGNTMILKGDCCVASYDENTLIVKSGKDSICISGAGLIIASMNADELSISGKFFSISFE